MTAEQYGRDDIVEHTEPVGGPTNQEKERISGEDKRNNTEHVISETDMTVAIGNETVHFNQPESVFRFLTEHTITVPVDDFAKRVNERVGKNIVTSQSITESFKLGLQNTYLTGQNKDVGAFCKVLDGLTWIQGGKLSNDEAYVTTCIQEYMNRFVNLDTQAEVGDYVFDRPAVDRFLTELITANGTYYRIVRDIVYPPKKKK